MSSKAASLYQRSVCEGFGTCLLVAAVVGSGIMGERLAGGNTAIALLANTIATGAALAALIMTFGPFSGAHFNPVVSLAFASRGQMAWAEVPFYLTAQFSGGLLGTILAHLMFGRTWYSLSIHERSGLTQLLSEFVATFGLMCVIWGCMKVRSALATPVAVAGYIVAAYWFTASTSFANPAVTVARSITDTFAGIRPVDVPGFILAQIAGALAATLLFAWLDRDRLSAAPNAQ
ncbi:MAG: MIP/aquaporin family protein [Candidatus Sulfotelmatobacter sp.]